MFFKSFEYDSSVEYSEKIMNNGSLYEKKSV